MTVTQISLYVLLGLVLVFYIRRILLTRSVRQYTPDEVAARVKGGTNAVLLDVRTPAERSAQHIKGSLHIPLQELRERIHELAAYKDREIICYCQSGNRSVTAALALRKQGLNSANLRGGIVEWNLSRPRR